MESRINLYLAQNLKALRKKNKKKQLEMALLFNIKQQNYSKLETGKSNFTDKVINNICHVFKITAEDFITRQDSTANSSKTGLMDDLATKILLASLQKQLTEKNLQIVEMEIAQKFPKQKKDSVKSNNVVYVMI
ncbi:MAG: helix-turn-helix transcriptional regulator [Bacteroidota bacterium]